MKRSLSKYIAITGVLALWACSDNNSEIMRDGNLYIDPSYIGEVVINNVNDLESRSGDDAETEETVYTYTDEGLRNSTILWISNGAGVVRKFNGLLTFPTDGERLVGGLYLAEAWAGDSVSASWTARYYKGDRTFEINGDANLNLRMTLANVFASVVIDKSIDLVLTDYEVTIGHSRGSKTFVGKDSRVASFMMPTNRNAGVDDDPKENQLKYVIKGTKFTGSSYTKEGVIDHVQEGHQYILTFRHNGGTPSIGGAFVDLELKDLDLCTNINYYVQPPTIQRSNGDDMSKVERVSRGKQEDKISVEIGAVGQVTNVQFTSAILEKVLGEGNNSFNFGGNLSSDEIAKLDAKGLVLTGIKNGVYYDSEKNKTSMKITFMPDLINQLDNGEYTVDILVEDDGSGDNTSEKPRPRVSRATMTILVSEDVIIINMEDIDNYSLPENRNITPSSVRLYGIIFDSEAQFSNPGLQYREKDTQSWSRVEPVSTTSRASGDFEFIIEGLKPNTTYEYCTFWTNSSGMEVTSAISVITTSSNAVTNGGFEDWSGSSPMLLCKSENSMYWDSGNHGSKTMGKDVTTSETSIKHSGNYSAKLQSQFVGIGSIGKFAAGNAFVGKYLKTDGTDGILGWGRPFYYKPTALKGYVKYTPGTVKYTASGAPDIVSGQPDKGIIYVALLTADKSAQGDSNYPDWPVVVRTSDAHLFKKDASNVIAYGELVLDEATQGSGMIEFTIPIEYYESMKNEDVYYLVLVCSASKGGDYFAGGDSVMYIDDFEFVY